MSNSSQVLVDQNRRYVIVLTGNTTTGPVCIVSPPNTAYALNTTGQIMTFGGNTYGNALPFYPLAVQKVQFCVTSAAAEEYVTLYWECQHFGNSNVILQLSGTGDIDLQEGGDGGALITNPTVGFSNGNIGLATVGMGAANSSYSIVLWLRKMTSGQSGITAWDQGQTADPSSFNQGNWGMNTH